MHRSEVISSSVSQDLGLRMAKGAAWMIGLRLSMRGIGVVSMVVLARLLVPADFGLAAMATALAGALAAMSDFGFQVALIQNQAADRRHYDTAWTLDIIRGLLVAGHGRVEAAELPVQAVSFLGAEHGPLSTTFFTRRIRKFNVSRPVYI